MNAGNLKKIISQNLRRNKKNLAFSAVGIIVGISSFVFFISLGAGINHAVTTKIFPQDANRLQVVARKAQFGALGGGRILDDEAIGQLAKLPGVSQVYPRMKLQFLATSSMDGRRISPAALNLLSRVPGISKGMVQAVRDVRMWLEIMGDGIDPRLVKQDVVTGEFKDPPDGKPIPVLLSTRMVEIYNSSFATARSLPKLDKKLLPFIPPIPLTLNHSYVSRSTNGAPVETRMKVVGLSRYALLGGITIPLETARKYNRKFVGDRAASTYDAVILQLKSSEHLGSTQEAISELGFEVDLREKQMAESVGLAITLVTLGFTLISLIIVGIAAVNIAHTFFMLIYERKRELGLMRALGASRSDIRRIILGEAFFLGTTGGVLGLGLGLAACYLSDLLMVRMLPDFPFKPDSFFSYPIWLFFSAVGFAIIFCWLGAIFPAQRASGMDPANALTGR